MYNRGVCIHHCSLSYCKRRNHIFFYDPSQFHQYGYQLFYKRHNNTTAYFMFFPARKSFLLKSLLSSICYMLFFSIFYALNIVFPLPMPLAVLMASVMVGFGYYLCISSNSSAVGFDVLAIILHNKNDSFPIAVTMRYINVIVVLLGFASYGWKSVLIGIVFTYFQTQLLHLLLKRHEKMIQCGNKVTASVSTCIVENERMTQ